MRGGWIAWICVVLFGVSLLAQADKTTFRIGVQDEPMTLNPFHARDVWSWKVLGLALDGLYAYDPEFRLFPFLAEGWPEYLEGEAAALVRLRKGVRWSDGTPFTAGDVAFTARLIMHFRFPMLHYKFEFVTKVEAVDDFTVKYHLDREYLKGRMTPIFFTDTLTTFVVQRTQWEPIFKEALTKRDPLGWFCAQGPEPLAGLGPFRIKEWRRGSYVHLVANEHYHGKGMRLGVRTIGPYIREILFRIYRTTDLAALALRRGEVDYIWWPIYPAIIPDLQRDPHIAISVNPDNGFFYLAFNLRKAPFKDLAFRQAVNILIDREFIVARVLWGYGAPLSTLVPPGNKFWHHGEIPDPGKGLEREERVAQARGILARAGYTWKEGRLVLPDGRPMTELVIFTPPADYDPLRWMATMLITRWLADIGVRAVARPLSFAELVHRVFDTQEFEAYVLGWSLGIDPDYLRVFFHSRYIQPGGYNCMAYSSPLFDQLAEESMLTMEEGVRRNLILKMQELLMAELPYLPLYVLQSVEARSKRFEGWVEQLGGIGNYWSFVFLRPVP